MTSSPDLLPSMGYVESTIDALCLILAARQGIIPRIVRRLKDAECKTIINSGAIFVFDEEESDMIRWTDGLLWSKSRREKDFFVYREMHKNSHANPKKGRPASVPLACREEKPGGLTKKTIIVNVDGSNFHLISYYRPEDIISGKLERLSSRPDIMSLVNRICRNST